jgi:hypothetical protein
MHPYGVFKVPLGGGAPTALHSTIQAHEFSSLQLVGGSLFWSDERGVWVVSTAGGTFIRLLKTEATGLPRHNLIHAQGPNDDYRLFHVNQALTNIFAGRPSLILWSWTKLFSASDGFNNYPYTLTADSNRVYYVRPGGYIYSIPRTGGTPSFLAVAASKTFVVTDGTDVYFFNGKSIQSVPVEGGATTTFSSGFADVSDMAIDTGTLYWTCSSCGTVMKKPLNGFQEGSTLAINQNAPTCLAVRGDRVYFGTHNELKWVAK